MRLFLKPNHKVSSRRQIDIRGVQDGILELSAHRYRLVMHATPINLELKSEAEQDAVITTYESVLNALPCPMQIIVRARRLDNRRYIDRVEAMQAKETEAVYKQQLTAYADFIEQLVQNNALLAREYYIVLAVDSDTHEDAHEQLRLYAELLNKGLRKIGVQTSALTSIEVLELFRSFYDPEDSKEFSLPPDASRFASHLFIGKQS